MFVSLLPHNKGKLTDITGGSGTAELRAGRVSNIKEGCSGASCVLSASSGSFYGFSESLRAVADIA